MVVEDSTGAGVFMGLTGIDGIGGGSDPFGSGAGGGDRDWVLVAIGTGSSGGRMGVEEAMGVGRKLSMKTEPLNSFKRGNFCLMKAISSSVDLLLSNRSIFSIVRRSKLGSCCKVSRQALVRRIGFLNIKARKEGIRVKNAKFSSAMS